MDTGIVALLVIVGFRFFVPFTILRWPLAGAIIAILADISDVMVFERFGAGPLSGELYHNFDKVFDTWYLFFEFLVVLKWRNKMARGTAITLFLWRFSGFTIFEFSTIIGRTLRPAFFLAPNIFEHFYLAWTAISKYFPKYNLTAKGLVIILLVVGLPKVAQEYIMHFAYPDQTWYFLRDNLFWWLYK